MKLSIIVPTLNEEKVLETTLRQIRDNLTEIEYELIVTDDGSRDRTHEIAKRHGRLTLDPSQKKTIATNRNNGAREAKGEFLAFVDADMFIPEPNRFFKTLLGDFAADPGLLAATVKIGVLPAAATPWDVLIMGVANFAQWFMNNAIRSGSASGEFQMIRREAFEAAHGYRQDLPMAEDTELFFRLSKTGRTMIDMRLVAYNTGRRPHAVGWPKLLWEWVVNFFSVRVFKRSYSKEWNRVG